MHSTYSVNTQSGQLAREAPGFLSAGSVGGQDASLLAGSGPVISEVQHQGS